jgi:hypothetical protein
MASDGRPCPFCNGTGIYHDAPATAPRELRWTLSSDRVTGTHVTMVGEVTEHANLDALSELPRPIILDMSGVRYLNTMGAMALVRLVETIGGGITAERCSPALVRQLNLMPVLSDHLKVRSVMVPFECESCKVDVNVIVELGSGRPEAPSCRCGTCAAELIPDEPIDRYLAFLPD